MRAKAAWFRGASVAGSLVFVVALAEGAARLLPTPSGQFTPRAAPELEPGMVMFRGLRDLTRPNVRGIYKGVVHETNDRGLRGPTRTRRHRPGVVRIGITGDSVTMGSGVEQRATYVARLERKLNASQQSPKRGSRYEVLNFGLAGINAADAMNRLVKFADDYHPDVIIYGFTPNDVQGPHYEKRGTKEERLERFQRALRLNTSPSHLVRLVGPSFRSLLERMGNDSGSIVREVEYNYFENPLAHEDFERALDVFAEQVRKHDGCGLVLIHTQLSELGWLHPWRHINAHVEDLAGERGVAAVQTFPFFAGREESSLWVGPTDPHPNAEGHRLLAEALFAGLDALPPHCLGSEPSK